jgi:hypothetical protein
MSTQNIDLRVIIPNQSLNQRVPQAVFFSSAKEIVE